MSESAGIAMAGLGAGFKAGAQDQAGQYTQQVSNYDASVADIQANDAIWRGGEAVRRQRATIRQTVGAQRASFGAQGQDPNDMGSSAGQVQQDTAYLGERDIVTLKNNAAREAWGYQVQATDYRMKGDIAAQTGKMEAVGTVLNTAGSLALNKFGFGTRTRAPTYTGGFSSSTGNLA